MKKFFQKKYIWVPIVLAIYAAVMALCNLDALDTAEGTRSFVFTLIVEGVILLLVSLFLKKRDEYKSRREAFDRKITEQHPEN